MGQIIPKLNLNKTPQQVDSNSLIFAKNVKLAKDNTIVRDDGISACINGLMLHTLYEDLQRREDEAAEEEQQEEDKLEELNTAFTDLVNGNNATLPIRYNNAPENVNNDDTKFYGIGEGVYENQYIDDLLFGNNSILSIISDYFGVDRTNENGVFGQGTEENPFIMVFDNDHAYNISSENFYQLIVLSKKDLANILNKSENDEKLGYLCPVISDAFYLYLESFAKYFSEHTNITEYYDALYSFREVRQKYNKIIEVLTKYFASTNNYICNISHKPKIYDEYAGQVYPSNYVVHGQQVTYYYYHLQSILLILEWFRLNTETVKSFVNQYYNLLIEHDEDVEYSKKDMYKYFKDIVLTMYNPLNYVIDESWSIVGVIPYNSLFYILYNTITENGNKSIILKYDEYSKLLDICNTNWKWSSGEITGNVTLNLRSNELLTIAESNDDSLIPLKTINLAYANYLDDESVYTQAPEIPICNLSQFGTYKEPIRGGVYQFFIRYKIHNNYYTKWFPCSKEIFAGEQTAYDETIVGTIKYVDENINATNSFIFDLDFIINNTKFKSYQLGYLLKTGDSNIARSWKEFDIRTTRIYFDNDLNYTNELDVRDLLETTFQLYDVKNLTPYKTKQYISNYKETDFNPDLQKYANDIIIDVKSQKINVFKLNPAVQEYVEYYDSIYDERGQSYKKTFNSLCKELGEGFIKSMNNYINNNYENPINYTESIYNFYITITTLFSATNEDIDIDENLYNKIREDLGIIENVPIYLFDTSASGIGAYVENNTIKYFRKSGDYFIIDQNGDAYLKQVTYCRIDNKTLIKDASGAIEEYPDVVSIIAIKVDNYGHGKYCYARFRFDLGNFDDTSELYNQITTLIPLQTYKFCVHYVTKNGEITNGYLLPDAITVPNGADNDVKSHSVFYPSFKNINIPVGFVSCFFSIINVGIKVSETYPLFEKDNDTNYNFDNDYYRCSLEINTNLAPITKGKLTIDGNTLYDTEYYSSVRFNPDNTTNTSILKMYGNVGILYNEEPINTNDILFLITNNHPITDINTNDELQLIKCTPYINTWSYDNYNEMNLLGYLCNIVQIAIPNLSLLNGGSKFDISKLSNRSNASVVSSVKNAIIPFSTSSIIIYSNYNYNFITVNKENIFTSLVQREGWSEGTDNRYDQIETYINSEIASSLFKLSSMYYDYTRKIFNKIRKNNITEFNNTVRSSILVGDEDVLYNYRFNSADYYNVPVHKGKITNLVAVGSGILVHTQDSMFRFSGYNSLSSAGGDDIAVTENNSIFDSGIVELLGSERGYGGLNDKHNSILTHSIYMFYDKDSNYIYSYDGSERLKVISDAIYKLINNKTVNNIDFAEDYINDRIFLNIKFIDNSFITLSYNTAKNEFISLHDFDYDYSFNTKTNCYFILGNNVYKIDKSEISYSLLQKEDNLYPSIIIGNKPYSIIDIIFKEQYDITKVLNSIKWICSKINNYTEEYSKLSSIQNLNAFLAEENLDRKYPGDYLEIYTDSTYTGLLNIREMANKFSIIDPSSYKYPRYNLGSWSLDYFRNILDTKNKNNSDNKSLIYGKYFVVRFIFNKENNFKLENLTFNTQHYE